MLSRSIGDGMATSVGCTAEPEVTAMDLRPQVDGYLVTASDGVWDVLDNTDVCKVRDRGNGIENELSIQLHERVLVGDKHKQGPCTGPLLCRPLCILYVPVMYAAAAAQHTMHQPISHLRPVIKHPRMRLARCNPLEGHFWPGDIALLMHSQIRAAIHVCACRL